MKKFSTKLISLFLCLVMLSASFSATVFAEDIEQTEPAVEVLPSEEFNVLKNLGFAQYFDYADETVSTIDFIRSVMLLGGMNTEGPVNTEIINTATDLGLIKNVNTAQNVPNAPITLNEAFCALVTMLGYQNVAEYKGGYPTGYIVQADQLDLNDGIDTSAKYVNGEMAARIIYNACIAPYNAVSGMTNGSVIYTGGSTILERIHNIKKVRGRVTKNSFTGFYAPIDNIGFITVGNLNLKNDMFDDTKLFGLYVDAWYDHKNNNKLIAIKENEDNRYITVYSKDIMPETNTSVFAYVDENGKDKKINLSNEIAVIYNGIAKNDFTDLTFKPDCGFVRLIKNQSGVYDVAIIENYRTEWVDNINMNTREISVLYGKKLELEPGLVYETVKIFNAQGDTMYFTEIKDDDVLMIMEGSGGKYVKIIVSRQSVTGTIEAISSSGDIKEYKINGEFYAESPTYTNLTSINKAELIMGAYGTFFLDTFGNISAVRLGAETDNEVGYLVATSKTVSGFDLIQAKIYGLDGKMHIYDFAEKVRFNSVRTVANKDVPQEFADTNSEFENSNGIRRQLITYRLNSEGQIARVDTPYKDMPETGEPKNSLQMTYNFTTDGGVTYWKVTSNAFDALVNVDDETKFMIVPPKNVAPTDKMFAVGDKKIIDNSVNYDIEAYKVSSGFVADYVLIYGTPTANADSQYYVFNGLVDKLDDEGIGRKYISCMPAYGKNATGLSEFAIASEYTGLSLTDANYGDLLKLEINRVNEVTSATMHYDYDKKIWSGHTSFMTDGTHNTLKETRMTFTSAEVFDGTILKCRMGTDVYDTNKDYEYYRPGVYKIIVVNPKDRGNKNVRIGAIQDIKTSDLYGAEYSRILVTQRYNDPYCMVIYNY